MTQGIYMITCKENGARYIGQSIDVETRYVRHLSALRHNKHTNTHLQNTWNKYGNYSFEFEILEGNLKGYELISKESEYIKRLEPELNITNNRYSHALTTFLTLEDLESMPIYKFGESEKLRPVWHKYVYGGAK